MKKSLIALLGLVVISSGCINSTGDPSETSSTTASPEEVTESYFSELTGYNTDYESAYELVSQDYRENNTYDNWYVQTQNMKNSFTRNGAELKIIGYEKASMSNNTAKVTVEYRFTQRGNVAPKSAKNFTLVKENNNWRLSEAYNPYSADLLQ